MRNLPSYDIRVSEPANSELADLDSDVQNTITDALVELSENPNPLSHKRVQKLECTSSDLFRLKVDRHRVIFGQNSRFLYVLRVAHRAKGVYDNLDHLDKMYSQEIQAVA